MTANDILTWLQSRGIAVALAGADLAVTPWHDLTDEDRQAIRDHKAELIALLKERSEPEVVEESVQIPNEGESLNPPEGGKAHKAQKSPANQNRAKWKPVTSADIQIAAERHRRRSAGEDGPDLPAPVEIPTLDARAKRKSDPLPPDGMCPGCAEPPRFQGHDTWWCPACRRWFQALMSSPDPEPVEGPAPTPSAAPEPPRIGTWARPCVLRGTKMPPDCPWATCNGWLVGSNPAQCSGCGTVFELKPPEDLGDLAGAGGGVARWVM